MVFYQFSHDGIPMNIAHIEKELLEKLGEIPSRVEFLDKRSIQLEQLCLDGIACTWHGKFSQETFDKLYADRQNRDIYLYFLNGKYKFKSWA